MALQMVPQLVSHVVSEMFRKQNKAKQTKHQQQHRINNTHSQTHNREQHKAIYRFSKTILYKHKQSNTHIEGNTDNSKHIKSNRIMQNKKARAATTTQRSNSDYTTADVCVTETKNR